MHKQYIENEGCALPEAAGGLDIVGLDALDIVGLRGAQRGHKVLQLSPECLGDSHRRRHLGNPVTRSHRRSTRASASLKIFARGAGNIIVRLKKRRRRRC